MADTPTPKPESRDLRSLQDELTELVRRSLAQRAQAEDIGARMRAVADEITKLLKLPTPSLPPTPPQGKREDGK